MHGWIIQRYNIIPFESANNIGCNTQCLSLHHMSLLKNSGCVVDGCHSFNLFTLNDQHFFSLAEYYSTLPADCTEGELLALRCSE